MRARGRSVHLARARARPAGDGRRGAAAGGRGVRRGLRARASTSSRATSRACGPSRSTPSSPAEHRRGRRGGCGRDPPARRYRFLAGVLPTRKELPLRDAPSPVQARARRARRASRHGTDGRRHTSSRATKVYCSGEPFDYPSRLSRDFSLSWHLRERDDRHVRVVNGAWEPLANPAELAALPPRSFDEWAARHDFCNFVFANAGPPERREFFEALSRRRFVHAPSDVETNTEPIPAGRRTPDWWVRKLPYLRRFRFTIAFENASLRGYTSEKCVDALLAGTVPIYWGNPEIALDVDPGELPRRPRLRLLGRARRSRDPARRRTRAGPPAVRQRPAAAVRPRRDPRRDHRPLRAGPRGSRPGAARPPGLATGAVHDGFGSQDAAPRLARLVAWRAPFPSPSGRAAPNG